MSLFEELKRRNVFRVGLAYVLMAWVVLQGADFVLDLIGTPDWVIRTMTVVAAAGLPVALFFAWAFEVTPEGIKREADVDRTQSISPTTGRKLDRAIIVFLALVIVLMGTERLFLSDDSATVESNPAVMSTPTDRSTSQGQSAVSEKSVAVLPFVNMSADADNEYFSDGISEEILNVLTRIPDLKVAARTSSFKFKGQNEDVAEIARQLRVSHVLEGSVRKSGDQLRITAQLIEADSGFHMWSETYDRRLEDVFAIQDEISAAISVALEQALAPQTLTESIPVDLTAYELFLKGRGLISQRGDEQLNEAIETLKAALNIAPDYAPAQASLAMAYAVLPWYSDVMTSGEAREQARTWAQSALEINQDNEVALATLAIVLRESDLNLKGSLDMLLRALAINPGSATVHNFLGDYYARSWFIDLALIHESRALELDPLGPVHATDLAQIYLFRGEFAKCIENAEQALSLSPGFETAIQMQFNCYFALGDMTGLQHSLALAEAAGLRKNMIEGLRLSILMSRGETTAAQSLLKESIAGTESFTGNAFNAAIIGDYDTAGRELLKALEAREGTWTFPHWIRLPEQAPDSAPWQEFWRQPGPKRLADERRANGMSPKAPTFGGGKP